MIGKELLPPGKRPLQRKSLMNRITVFEQPMVRTVILLYGGFRCSGRMVALVNGLEPPPTSPSTSRLNSVMRHSRVLDNNSVQFPNRNKRHESSWTSQINFLVGMLRLLI